MPSSLTLSLAWRLLTHTSNRFARFVTWVSFIGLALGVMVLTVVVTVMNGFDHELRSRLLRSIPHVTVDGGQGQTALAEAALSDRPGAVAHDYFRGLGAITISGQVYPVTLYGFSDTATGIPELRDSMVQGSLAGLAAEPHGIVLGVPLARALRLRPGDPVLVVAAQANQDQVQPRLLRFQLSGTFALGAEPDYNLALVNIDRFEWHEWATLGEVGLQIQLSEPLVAAAVAQQLGKTFPRDRISSWEQEFGELFRAVQLEKSMMFVLLLLVVAIASFNIIAGQTMLVNDKRRSIAILRTMGGTRDMIRNVFLLQGLVISVSGTGLGLGLGLLCAAYINDILAGLEALTGMHLLDGSFFVEVPARVLPTDLTLIAALSAGLCLVSAWLPARRAADLDPVSGLH